MAEALAAVGLAGSVVQFVDFSSKVTKRLREFQSSLDEKNNIFSDLVVILPLMKGILDRLNTSHEIGCLTEQNEAVLPVIRKCIAQLELLEALLTKTIPKENESTWNKRWKALRSLAREESVKKAVERLDWFSKWLIWHELTRILNYNVQIVNRLTPSKQFAKTSESPILELLARQSGQPSNKAIRPDAEEETSQELSETNKRGDFNSTYQSDRKLKILSSHSVRRNALCLQDRCGCSCHKMLSKSGRFWSWKFPSLANLVGACNRPSCANKVIRTSFYISFSRFNIRQAIYLGLGFAWGESGYSMSLILRPSRTVKETPPGFVILWKCKNRLLEWPEAQKMLANLFHEKEASPDDVDPAGRTWLEKLLECPWTPSAREAQFGLLKMLLESGAKPDTDTSLLYLCARWIGEGPHLDAVEKLLDYGYDVSLVNSQSLLRWPKPSDPNWISEELTPDPFFIELIGKCVKNDPSFGDTTPLMEAVLIRPEQEVCQYLSKPCDSRTNFLGQSVLHLAILRPKVLRMLISNDQNLDLPDKYGTTPLMYAAAYNKVESAILLLERGANPLTRDGLWFRNFFLYAIVRDNWSFITEVASRLKQIYTAQNYQIVLNDIMQSYVLSRENRSSLDNHFEELLSMGTDSNLVLRDGSTLLHCAQYFNEVKALFEAGFVRINQQDNDGTTPLMRVVGLFNASLVQTCLDKGATIHEKDRRGWTVMHHIAKELRRSTWSYFYDEESADWHLLRHSELIDTIRLLLRRGADPTAVDHCACACSLSGCTPSTVLLGKGDFMWRPTDEHLWSLEWLQTLSELGPENIGEQILFDWVRAKQFNDNGLTHVCCQRTPMSAPLDDDDVDEILDEENEGIQELSRIMQSYKESSRDSILDRWIEHLSLIGHKPRKYSPVEGNDLAGQHLTLTNPFARWKINTSEDTFEAPAIFYRLASDSKEIDVREYCVWLEYYHNNQTKLSTPSSVDGNWYRTRMSWASRLERALKYDSTSAHEEVINF